MNVNLNLPAVLLLAAFVCPAALATAQSATPDGASPQAGQRTSPAHVVRAERPPTTLGASAQTRVSTAESGGTRSLALVKALPALAVQDRTGAALDLGTLARKDHWLLVLRQADCIPCDRLMNGLAASESSALQGGKPYVILVAGSQAAAAAGTLDTLRARYGALNSASWVTDNQKLVVGALHPTGTPMLYGMNGNEIVWRLAGTFGDPASVEKIATSWLTTKTPARLTQSFALPVAAAPPAAALARPAGSGSPQP